jgi:hypothetical protein
MESGEGAIRINEQKLIASVVAICSFVALSWWVYLIKRYRSATVINFQMYLVYELTSGPRGYKSSCVRIVRRRLVYGVV